MLPDNKRFVKGIRSEEKWLAKWSEKKALSRAMAARLKSCKDWRLRKRGERMEQCADLVSYNSCEDCGGKHVRTVTLCRDRVCPLCNWRLANKRWVTLYNALYSMYDPGLKYHLVTLTIRNIRPDRLSEALQHMSTAWHRVLQRNMLRHYVMGWARSVEITYNHDTGMMHPHYHIILVTESLLTQEEFDPSEILYYWMSSITKEGELVTLRAQDVREIKVKQDEDDNLLAAALEVYKYTIKQHDLMSMPMADFMAYAKQIAGKRLTATGGIIKAKIKTDLDDIGDDQLEVCPTCGSTNLAAACMEWAGTTYRII